MDRETIQSLIKQCSLGLFDLACAVSGHPSWDLNLPVGVIDARRSKPKLMVSAIGTINSTLKASSTIAHPLMVRLFERFEDVGLEQALTEMKRGEDGRRSARSGRPTGMNAVVVMPRCGASKTPQPLWCSPARLTLIVKWPASPFFRGIPTASSPFQFPSPS